MLSCIKEVFLMFIGVFALIGTCSVHGSEVPLFNIPIEVEPGGAIVLVPSYDGINFDLEKFIDKSNETGLYPTWGWTGEYYEYGVTHGEVERFLPEAYRHGEIFSNNTSSSVKAQGSVVPTPGTLNMGLILGGLFLLRRRRG